MIKVGVRDGEVVLRIQTERDHRILMALIDTRWVIVTVRGEDVTEEARDLHDALGEVEWS